MGGQPLVFQNFSKGVNNVVSASALDPTEVQAAVNFDLTSTGTFQGRPPIVKVSAGPMPYKFEARNYAPNPSFEVDVTGVTAVGGPGGAATISRQANTPFAGTYSARCTWSTASTAPGGGLYVEIPLADVGLEVGDTISVGFYRVRLGISNRLQFSLEFRTDSTSISTVTGPEVQVTANTNYTTTHGMLVEGEEIPATCTRIRLRVLSVAGTGYANWPNGSVLQVDGVMVNKGNELLPYFDGDTADTPTHHCDWDGTPGASTSTIYTIVDDNNLEPIDMLDWFTDDTGTVYGVFTTDDKTWLWEPISDTWTEIASFKATDCAQYNNRLYLVYPGGGGGYWGRTPTPSDPYGFVSLASGPKPMPAGQQIALYRDRMWITGPRGTADASTIFFSNITSTSAGTTIDEYEGEYIAINPGDGQEIVTLRVGQNDMFIFRDRSTWRFVYEADPALGRLTPISQFVGADTPECVAVRENYFLTYSNGTLYELINYNFYPMNSPKRMRFVGAGGSHRMNKAVTLVGNRALVYERGNTFAFDVSLRAWTTWESPATSFAFGLRYPEGNSAFGVDAVYGVSGADDGTKFAVYRILDTIDGTNKEEMTCRLLTRAYDFEQPGAFKRMWWWGANVATGRDVVGRAIPLILSEGWITYDQMEDYTYDDLDNGTYDYPITPSPEIETLQLYPSSVPGQVFVKMHKGIRFRQCAYEVELSTDGSTDSGPVRVDSITVFAEVKTKVSKVVS